MGGLSVPFLLKIGDPVSLAHAGSVIFLDVNAALAEDNANFQYSAATSRLTLGKDASIAGILIGKGAGTGVRNVRVSDTGLSAQTTAGDNTAIGANALSGVTNGNQNTAIGSLALRSITSQSGMVAVGYGAMSSAAPGNPSTAVGSGALPFDTLGSNVAIGDSTGTYLSGGSRNVIIGSQAIGPASHLLAAFSNCIAIGYQSNLQNGSGNNNITIGSSSGLFIEGGSNNICIGSPTGQNIVGGSGNILLGHGTNVPANGTSNYLNLGGVLTGNYVTGPLTFNVGVNLPASSGVSSASISGTATNDNAAAGRLGEYLQAQVTVGSAVALTTGVTANVTSISLTAGDWDVTGVIDIHPAATTNINNVTIGSSATSATIGPQDSSVTDTYQVTSTVDLSHSIPVQRYSLAAPTTVYLVINATFSVSTLSAYGTIKARRVR